MLWICESIGSLRAPYLAEYVAERARVLEETGMDKMEVLKLLNKDYNNLTGQYRRCTSRRCTTSSRTPNPEPPTRATPSAAPSTSSGARSRTGASRLPSRRS
jgi:hypothetical protein